MGNWFPFSWGEWQAAVRNAYELQEILELKSAAGSVLSKEEQDLLKMARVTTARYTPDGRKISKDGAKRPLKKTGGKKP